MNKRIEELAIETFFDESTNGSDQKMYTFGEEKMQLFAELIVRECANEIMEKGKDWIDFAPSQIGIRPEYWDMSQHIKEHFGIEE